MFQHSEIKVKLYDIYIQRYLQILSLSKYINDIHLFDLFAGEGIYENGGKGSPIVAMEAVKKTYFANRGKSSLGKFNCFFNDGNFSKIEKLKAIISERNLHYPVIGNLEFSNQEYEKLLPEIISKINRLKNDKAFVFLDPYGYKEIKVNDIKNLVASKKSEVLLFLPTQFMFRFEKKGTPECLSDFIKDLLPEQDWPKSETGIDFIETMLEAFRKKLPETFVDSFIITREKNQFFCLFFFTSHIYGFERMLESKWNLDTQEGRGWALNSDFDLWSYDDTKPNTRSFENKLEEFLKNERTNGEVYNFTLKNGHLVSHTNEILKKLQGQNKLICQDKKQIKARKGAFYINYDNYKNSPEKITIKIKK